MTREQLIEAMARACMEAAWARIGGKCDVRDNRCEHGDCPCSDVALLSGKAALAALEDAIPGLSGMIDGETIIAPNHCDEGMANEGLHVLGAVRYPKKRRVMLMLDRPLTNDEWAQIRRAMDWEGLGRLLTPPKNEKTRPA